MIALLLLIQASLFACGASLFAMLVLALRRPKRWYGYFAVKLSVMMTVGTVMWRILLAPGIHLNWHDPFTLAYAIGVVLADVGLVVVVRDMMQHSGRRIGSGLGPAHITGPIDSDDDIADVISKKEEKEWRA